MYIYCFGLLDLIEVNQNIIFASFITSLQEKEYATSYSL